MEVLPNMTNIARTSTSPATVFRPGSSVNPTATVEITISLRDLPDLDLLSKSDPMCVVYMQPFGENRWQEISRTETIANTRNPDFTKKINLLYRFEEQQKLRFEVYDIDSLSQNLKDHDFIGWTELTLGQLVSQGIMKKNLEYYNPGLKRGSIILVSEELASTKDEVELQIIGQKLDKKDFFGKSDPFLVFHKATESGDFIAVFKTEVIKKTLNPVWNQFAVPVRTLCNGDYERTLRIDCYDWNRSGDHELIGSTFTNLRKLAEGPLPLRLPCINSALQKKKKNYKDSGTLEVVHCKIKPIHSFLDYIRGGTEIHCTFAIDFTASNGDPFSPSSLHYFGAGPTLYERALSAVGEIIEDYDSDKQFPVLGFGARLPPDGKISHEFFVNMNPTNPYCNQVQGILAAYRSCLPQIQLYGPTHFSPCIRHVTRFASKYRDGSNYFILLILTDGIITDIHETKEVIVEASSLPLSIIIIGIGSADFTAMEELDSDTSLLVAPSGRKASRDIVQFVPFSKYLSAWTDPGLARLHLARDVLQEIPEQFLGFMKANNFAPKPPRYDLQNLPPDPEAVQL